MKFGNITDVLQKEWTYILVTQNVLVELCNYLLKFVVTTNSLKYWHKVIFEKISSFLMNVTWKIVIREK